MHICTFISPTDIDTYINVLYDCCLLIKMKFKYTKQKIMPPWQTILQHQTTAAYLAVAILTTCSFCLGSPCHSDSWWDPVQDKCIQCTRCENQLIVLRPCQLHQDTVCGTINDLEIDWMLLTRTEPNWKERRKERIESIETERNEPDSNWDWQTTSLILAVLACLLFFLAAAYISLQHMRQWRRMERRLDRDVEELSAKLMARLAEVQNIENGSFLIENPIKDPCARPVEVRCVYLEQLLADKESVKSPLRGNVYIEEASSK